MLETWTRCPDRCQARWLRLTLTHQTGGPCPVYALGGGNPVLVFESRVADDPYDLALLVHSIDIFLVFSIEDNWWAAEVFIWETKYLISSNGSTRY